MKKVMVYALVILLSISSLSYAAEHVVPVVAAQPIKDSFFNKHCFVFWPRDNKRFPLVRHIIAGSILWGLIYYLEKNFILTPSTGTALATETITTLLGDKLQKVADELNIDLDTINIYVSPITSSEQLFFNPNNVVIQEQLFNILSPDELLFAITHQLILIKNSSTLGKIPASYLSLIASFYTVKNIRDWGNGYLDKTAVPKTSFARKIINNGLTCFTASLILDNLLYGYYNRYLIFNADNKAAELLGYDLALAYLQKVQVAEPYLMTTPSIFTEKLKINHYPITQARIDALTTNTQKGYDIYE